MATHIAGATATIMWILMERLLKGKATTLGAASGAIAGLATITPAAGFVGPMTAALIGMFAGSLCYLAIMAKNIFKYDDSLDVVGIHGVGGVIGLLAAGFFATKTINPDGANGVFFGNAPQLGIQCLAVFVTVVYAFLLSYVLLKIVDKIFGLRVAEDEEVKGLDLSQHNEAAYSL